MRADVPGDRKKVQAILEKSGVKVSSNEELKRGGGGSTQEANPRDKGNSVKQNGRVSKSRKSQSRADSKLKDEKRDKKSEIIQDSGRVNFIRAEIKTDN